MSPSGKSGPSAEDSRRTKALDSAVRKVEEKSGKPDTSTGGAIRQGWKEGASS